MMSIGRRQLTWNVGLVLMAFLPVVYLRERHRTINNLPGEGLVMRMRELNLTTRYSFQWEVRGMQDDASTPVLKLATETGYRTFPRGPV